VGFDISHDVGEGKKHQRQRDTYQRRAKLFPGKWSPIRTRSMALFLFAFAVIAEGEKKGGRKRSQGWNRWTEEGFPGGGEIGGPILNSKPNRRREKSKKAILQ